MAEQVLIRHAAAGSRERWKGGDDRLRPLSKKGRRQAEGLVRSLASIPVERVLSSPYRRCVETVEPLARARGLRIEESEALAEGAGLEAVLALLRELAGRPSALCTHGDIMYEVCEELVRLGLVPRHEVRYEKGAAWILEERDGKLVGARHVAPPE
ncbi:phosphoglycerate mutase family protein [Candidatus Nephthysia bennettiae]|uniref:Histidine phosphatase family protein n=1 Tax=Candidatus Nephthysia bennettiae TaxID=3127016 RepID=A0A934NA05_9BACT|nr:histidine phosphatase family protein [Candidatus Dormibacteraeota bacterium]MBJ7611052.1 histidine phosphatase family protein [Candidatus Dormibacteraeota bacterium]